MLLSTIDAYSIRLVTMYCSLTCIYIPLIFLILVYTENAYNIGKYSSFSLIISIVLAECIKVILSLLVNDVNFGSKENKTVKVKKCYSKLKVKEVFKSISVVLLTTAIYYLLAVLFGAPLLTQWEETFMLSSLVAVLTVFPACINNGADAAVSLLVGTKPQPGDVFSEMMLRNIQITWFWTWLSTIVIPLDWSRPWQDWPIPCSLGAMFGYIIAHIFTLFKITPSIIKVYARNIKMRY